MQTLSEKEDTELAGLMQDLPEAQRKPGNLCCSIPLRQVVMKIMNLEEKRRK